jgi:hypothetical protein
MADIKVIYKNANGYDQEHSESGDSVKFLSFKTANKELTDAKLSNLIDGADSADEHIHDARYYRENEFIATSAGAGDAGKPVKTDAGGKIDASLIDDSDIDHGSIGGLGDDDHTQYLRTDGTRALTGIQSYNSHPTFTADTQLVDKKYVDDVLITSEWYPYSALDYVADNTIAPVVETTGTVYVLSHDGGTPNAAYDGAAAGDIVRFNGTVWVATTPTTGTRVAVDNEASVAFYLWGGSSWAAKYEESTTASTGLVKVGFDIRLDASSAGAGLGFSSGVLSVNVDSSTIEINSDTLRVKADGINDTHIDWGTGANQVSAADVPIADAGNYTAQTQVEGALQELYGLVGQVGVNYTVAVGGVTKGFPVYVSANDTVAEYGALTNTARVIGLAATTETAAATVKVLANDTVLTGVLSGATAGQTIYWSGSALTATLPSGGGAHVWKVGVAKNATDLHVEVEFIKKNA